MLKSNEKTGLSELECEERRKKYGDNKVFIPYKTSVVGNIKNFLSPHIFLSFFVGAFLVYMHKYIGNYHFCNGNHNNDYKVSSFKKRDSKSEIYAKA